MGDANQALNNRADVFSRAPAEPEKKLPDAEAEPASPPVSSATPPDRCTNVIAAGARWQGTLNVEDSVRIDGAFSGEVRSKGTVHVSEGAKVDAKIRALFVVIQGTVKGEIRCEQRVELQPKSRVSGELFTKLLSVQEGAILDSKVEMGATPEAEGDTPASRSKGERDSHRQQPEKKAEQQPRAGAATTPSGD